jgi:hypothetical protein
MKQILFIAIIIFLVIVSFLLYFNFIQKTNKLKSNENTLTFTVRHRGNSSYIFEGSQSGDNISINVNKGDILVFNINALGHPFLIKTERSTGTRGSLNIPNNGSETGNIIWDTSNVDTGTYYYNCQIHRSMGGEIIIS